MVFNAITAFVGSRALSQIVATVVLPGGCPLACPFCIVDQRQERQIRSALSTDHLQHLISSLEKRGLLGAAAIVGDEPLQAPVWPMAKAFLDKGAGSGVPTALISNGYNLIDFIPELIQLDKTKILISLDAASEEHDMIRRKAGAFARISEGLREAVKYPQLRDRISIATILMPGNRGEIEKLIDFTARLQIPQLLVSPLLTSSRSEPLTVHPRILREGWRDLPRLMERARAVGVKLRVSDEFAMLGAWEEKLTGAGIEIVAPAEPARLIRIDAAGRVETLATMQAGTSTGLQLPEDVQDVDSFVSTLVETCFPQMEGQAVAA